jgi:hypothetical protein
MIKTRYSNTNNITAKSFPRNKKIESRSIVDLGTCNQAVLKTHKDEVSL